MGLKENIAIVDEGGHLLAFGRMDGARPASVYTAITKATTAATVRLPSGPFPPGTQQADPLLNLSLENAAAASGGKLTTLYGGVPVYCQRPGHWRSWSGRRHGRTRRSGRPSGRPGVQRPPGCAATGSLADQAGREQPTQAGPGRRSRAQARGEFVLIARAGRTVGGVCDPAVESPASQRPATEDPPRPSGVDLDGGPSALVIAMEEPSVLRVAVQLEVVNMVRIEDEQAEGR